MMQVEREPAQFIGTPVLEDLPRPDPEDRFLFRYLSNDRVEVRHPFHGPVILGDQSAFPDPAVDDLMVQIFEMYPYMVDSMKLNRTRRFETHRFAGEYPQLSHGFSLACIARVMGGGPLDVIEAMANDLSHTHGGHGDEDLFQQHGQENIHDLTRVPFFKRSGFTREAIRREIFVGPHQMLRGTRMVCTNILEEQTMDIRRTFLNNNHKSRRFDADRWQYNDEEDYHTGRISRDDSDKSLASVVRLTVPLDNEGEQLVYTDTDTGFSSSKRYMRKNAEHWMEPVQDLISDATNVLKAYLFVCDSPTAQMYFQDFQPRDYLYSSASRFYQIVDQVAEEDPVVAWLVSKIESWAEHQRGVMDTYDDNNLYQGPKPPDGITLVKLDHEITEASMDITGNHLKFVLPPGKLRTIDPRVLDHEDKTLHPVSVRRKEEYAFYRRHYSRWLGTYTASVEIDNPEMVRLLERALKQIDERWDHALRRPSMDDSVLRSQIAESNEFVKRYGAVMLRAS